MTDRQETARAVDETQLSENDKLAIVNKMQEKWPSDSVYVTDFGVVRLSRRAEKYLFAARKNRFGQYDKRYSQSKIRMARRIEAGIQANALRRYIQGHNIGVAVFKWPEFDLKACVRHLP